VRGMGFEPWYQWLRLPHILLYSFEDESAGLPVCEESSARVACAP